MNVASTFGRIHYLSSLFDIHCVVVATLFAWTHFVGGHSSVQSTQTHRPQSSISTRPWVLLCWMQEHRALLITHIINERQQQKIKKKHGTSNTRSAQTQRATITTIVKPPVAQTPAKHSATLCASVRKKKNKWDVHAHCTGTASTPRRERDDKSHRRTQTPTALKMSDLICRNNRFHSIHP